MTIAERDLLDKAIAGDPEALSMLLEAHGPSVRRRLRGRIPRKWQSVLSDEHVMQESYADAFLSVRQFSPIGDDSFVRWFGRIARNSLVDAIRGLETEKRGGNRLCLQAVTTEDSAFRLYEILVASGTTPSQHAVREETIAHVRKVVADLPRAYSEVVELYDLKGLSANEVAARLGCSAGAVFMRRARALRLLGELLRSPFS